MSLSQVVWYCSSKWIPGRLALLALLGAAVSVSAQRSNIDLAQSTITIRVFKSGLFSALAHDHAIQAPIASGSIDPQAKLVELTFNVADMKVLDPGESDSNRKEIDATMKGPKVLDGTQFPSISFTSSSVKAVGSDRSEVVGTLKLHGISRTITVPVTFSSGKYTGSVPLKQTDYGITPVKIAGGTVRVKDQITIEFSIVPAAGSPTSGMAH